MSLDVYLEGPGEPWECDCRNCGTLHESTQKREYYSANITHNLTTMADKAGIYYALWRPEEKGWTRAKDIIEPLRAGLAKLESDHGYFAQFNAENGWGLYEHFVPFVRNYLEACEQYPDAEVHVSR